MAETTEGYALTATTRLSFEDAVARAREALAAQGFGVLCEIDVQSTLRQRLDVETGPYVILGACNPPLAHQAVGAEPDIGVFLPCNVIVYERDGEVVVSAVDAERMLSLVGRSELDPIAEDVRGRFQTVVDDVASAA